MQHKGERKIEFEEYLSKNKSVKTLQYFGSVVILREFASCSLTSYRNCKITLQAKRIRKYEI